jgi:hypothetical protein
LKLETAKRKFEIRKIEAAQAARNGHNVRTYPPGSIFQENDLSRNSIGLGKPKLETGK